MKFALQLFQAILKTIKKLFIHLKKSLITDH